MRVKRLEIQGFKSFKDKTVIHFDDGVTGIVGPNGCGKSNIVDAFFWVMGEQSVKHMRADGQLDLIFNGSEKYSPLSMAEVSLILSTGASETTLPDGVSARDLPPHLRYEEISVTRRLYRDGESAFFINGQLCRLKDIHELFMDTGAGPKAYSIIEQGAISKIVASKPEDRRTIIEEAAGITKFKARKKESLRKIEATQQNLLRINDIVAEIERQLATLEKQAAKARQYKKYKEELQTKEMLVGRKKLFGLKVNVENARTQLRDLEISEVENRNALQTAELRIENLKIQLAEAQRVAEDSQNTLQALQRDISQTDTRIQLHKRQIQELENSNTSLDEENLELHEKIERLTQEKQVLEEEAQKLAELFQNADSILKEHQTRLDEAKARADELGRGLEQQKRDLMSKLNRQSEISNQVHAHEARVDGLSVQINSLNDRVKDRELDCEILQEKFTTAKELFESTSAEASVAREQHDTLKTETQSLDTELRQLRTDEAASREERTKIESRHRALQQLVESYEGLQSDVKNILKESEFAQGLSGIFADKVEAHPGFEYALETVLRDYLENFFVNDSSKASSLVEALKEKNLGRASFWAMDLLEAAVSHLDSSALADLQTKVHAHVASAVPLKDAVRLQSEHADAVLKVFGTVYVVDSVEEAVSAFKKTANLGVTYVSRAGDMVDRFGRVSGGSTKSLEGGFLARKAELQKLSEQLVIVKEKNETLSARLHEVETLLQTKKEALEQVTARLRDLDLSAKTSERDLASFDSQLAQAKTDLDRQKSDLERLSAERQSLWEKLDSIRQELSGMEGSTREHEQEIEQRTFDHQSAVQNASELQGALIQLKVDFTTANEKQRHGKQNLERIASELHHSSSRKEEVERLMNRKLDEKDLFAQELEVFETQMHEMTLRAQEVEAILRERKNDFEKLNAQMSEAFEQQRTYMKATEETSAKLGHFRLEQERCSMEFQMLYQSLFQRYGLEEAAIAPKDEEERAQFDALDAEGEIELQSEVDKLHERIRRLGEVNVMAVEEYDEQKKRHEFLVLQRDDLLKSIRDLEHAIERINKTSEERFKLAFEEINVRFQRIYPVVFGGGWGKLLLTNPEDFNETGVDIIAEPPGKKVGSIQLMSGGEKALTAVALIFSIFLIKPSPFCVLDEVDAPLDDHNVGKFNALLKEMARKSQFIIITHNKRTMELNDKLYGVTMEEPGVSKMVSIQIQ